VLPNSHSLHAPSPNPREVGRVEKDEHGTHCKKDELKELKISPYEQGKHKFLYTISDSTSHNKGRVKGTVLMFIFPQQSPTRS